MKRSTEAPIEAIGLDAYGRVAIADTQLAEDLAFVSAIERRRPVPPSNTNCVNFCNVKQGCGPVNKRCSPNTVPNCGCRSVE